MKTILTFLLLAIGFLTACAQQDENRFKERAQIEENAKTKADLDVLNARAKEMESDLLRRHRFYQSLSGIYTGTYTTPSGASFVTKLRLIASLPPYVPGDRIRTLEEIASDINNLYFNIQILHWAPNNLASATPCAFQEVRGNLEKGRVDMAGDQCLNVYSARIVDPSGGPYQKPGDLEANSTNLAQKILANEVNAVDTLKVIMQPSNYADEYVLELKRVP